MNPRGGSAHLPWRCDGTNMSPHLLLMSKLLLILVWQRGHFGHFPLPYLPFLPGLDVHAGYSPFVSDLFRAAFAAASALLLFNVAVRPAAFTAGTLLILSLVLSKPLFHNHLLLPGCLLFLASCHRRGAAPRLVHGQFALVYFGACLNKMREPDWWNGRFMDTFLTEGNPSPFYLLATDWMPGLGAAVTLSVASMTAEALLALLFLLPRTQPWGVWVMLGFHGAIFFLTCGSRFGHFLEDLFIGALAFLAWPLEKTEVRTSPRWQLLGQRLSTWLDWDRRCMFRTDRPTSPGSWLEIIRPGVRSTNEAAVRDLIRYSTSTYFILFLVDYGSARILPWKAKFAFDVLLLAAMVLALLPLPWSRKRT